MAFRVARYLAPFHPKRVPHHFTDVLIIGGGVAGLRAAIQIDPRCSVLIVTKDALQQSNSHYAQGGIAGVLDPEDCFDNHVSDTLGAGCGLCDRQVVEQVVKEAPGCIRELINWGTKFDSIAGELDLGREGGHSHHRIVHALGDATGKELMRAIIGRATDRPETFVWPNTFTIDLLTHQGVCRGALVWNERHGKTLIWSKQTILCTGGIGQLYRESTNPQVATGDGHALAFRAGAEMLDMEFVQFHPTVLYIAGSSRSLITEAVRGEGAHLVDADGNRFMPHYDQRAELAPRDVVSQAIVAHMEKMRLPHVYLDLSHLDADFVRNRFPGINRACAEFGIDITRDRIPVRPGAHYMIGGVRVDSQGRTNIPGLLAAGEVTASGLHGANRLASNSLLEGLVYGKRAGHLASVAAATQDDDFWALPLSNPPSEPLSEPLDVADIRNALKSLMWRSVGVRREKEKLQTAAETIDTWAGYVLRRQFNRPTGWELQNMLIVARLIINAAMAREESRGVHMRTDVSETRDEFRLRQSVRLDWDGSWQTGHIAVSA